ncbi:MAG: fluoride efflux transporter CrcB [bacterium]|mgnify:CR=1 FL=1|nr:fluoride efflux transporter CrcB [bacterium]
MLKLLAIFTGGGIGAVLRFLVGFLCKNHNLTLPIATFFVNIIGSFIIGFVLAYSVLKTDFSPTTKLFLTVGFCGGLTTFSTFSAECLDYLASGKIIEFFIYTLLSVAVCVVAAGLGAYGAKLL